MIFKKHGNKNEENNIKKGSLKRTFSILGRFTIPWHLYVLEFLLGILQTKTALLYIPYYSSLQTGDLTTESLEGYLLFTLLNIITSTIASIPTFYAAAIINRDLQKKMTAHALRLPIKYYEKNSSQIVNWITSDCGGVDGLIGVLISFLSGVVTVFMSMDSIGALDKSMIALVPGIILLILFFTWLEGKLLFLRQKREKLAGSELTAYYSEHLSYIMQIKQLHAEENERERSRKAIDKYYHAEVYMMLLTLLNNFTSGSMSNIITILVFIVGVPLVRSGVFDLAGLAAFQNYIMVAYGAFSSILSSYTSLMYSNGNLYYIGDFLNQKEEVVKRKVGMNQEDQDIVFDKVSFSYNEDSEILHQASFTVPKGKKTLLVGPNGSGKSTIFKLIERFYDPDSGNIYFGKYDTADIHLDEWRQSIAYVLQEPSLFSGTIRENIVYGMNREVGDDEVKAAAKLACADEFIEGLPGGYDFQIGDNGSRLSGGQRQRIAIARAVMLDPAYLLLDEATCNMDVYSEKAVMDALFALMEGRTTVMISHDMRMLDKADHVVVLKDGCVETDNTPEEAARTSETLQQLISGSSVLSLQEETV